MRCYRGTINWFSYAVNESCVFAFPGTFDVGQPVYCLWQWTVDATGAKKPNVFLQGHINTSSVVDGKLNIDFHEENYYKFQAVINADHEAMTVTMRNPKGDKSKPMALSSVYNDPKSLSKFFIYTGKLNYSTNATNEMISVIMSPTMAYGDKIGVFWQWTKDWQGHEKVAQTYVGTITSFNQTAKGITLEFISDEDYYKFRMTVDSTKEKMLIRVAETAAGLNTASDNLMTLAKSNQ